MKLTSEVKEDKFFFLDIDPEHSLGECMLMLYRSNYSGEMFHTYVKPTIIEPFFEINRNKYRVGEWTFVRYNGHVNYTLVVEDHDGVPHDICEFRPSVMELIVKWSPRLAKTAELFKVGAEQLIHRERRAAKINKFIPVKKFKIKSLLTK